MPASNTIGRMILPAVLGALIGGGAVAFVHRNDRAAAAGSAQTRAVEDGAAKSDFDALRADVARLKANAPSQSHTMSDVGYHWTNLWFAADQKNWPLAQFYFEEARQHILWTIRIRPIRKDLEGRDVDLKSIFDAVDVTSFAATKMAIAQKDGTKFVAAYKQALDGCYACHKASGKPYLHPVVPQAPAQSLIDFAPSVDPS